MGDITTYSPTIILTTFVLDFRSEILRLHRSSPAGFILQAPYVTYKRSRPRYAHVHLLYKKMVFYGTTIQTSEHR